MAVAVREALGAGNLVERKSGGVRGCGLSLLAAPCAAPWLK